MLRSLPVLKCLVFVSALCPLVWLIYELQVGALEPDPAKALVLELGIWAYRFLLLALCVTPLRQLTGWAPLMRLRRMVGLFAFFYGFLHLISYLWFLLGWRFSELWQDVLERRYITVGFLGFVILLLMAVTSFKALQRKMGRRWVQLHSLVYVAGVAVAVHFYWLSRINIDEAVLYGLMMLTLLGWRAISVLIKKANKT